MTTLLSIGTEDEGDIPIASLSKGEYSHPLSAMPITKFTKQVCYSKHISVSLAVRLVYSFGIILCKRPNQFC